MKYKQIYSFLVLDNIRDGKTVYLLDRKARAVICVNDMCVSDLVEVINTEDTTGRFEFWHEEVSENVKL
jgi:urease gamma subunit